MSMIQTTTFLPEQLDVKSFMYPAIAIIGAGNLTMPFLVGEAQVLGWVVRRCGTADVQCASKGAR